MSENKENKAIENNTPMQRPGAAAMTPEITEPKEKEAENKAPLQDMVSPFKAAPEAEVPAKAEEAKPAAEAKTENNAKDASSKKKSKKNKKALPNQGKSEVSPRILLCTPIPAFKSTWNINDAVITNEIIPIQQAVAKKYGLQVIDLHTLYANDGDKMLSDGIHPDGKGARRMAEIIAEKIKE